MTYVDVPVFSFLELNGSVCRCLFVSPLQYERGPAVFKLMISLEERLEQAAASMHVAVTPEEVSAFAVAHFMLGLSRVPVFL